MKTAVTTGASFGIPSLVLGLFVLLSLVGCQQSEPPTMRQDSSVSKPDVDGTVGDKGMVVGTTGAAAVQAGADILKAGGTAMDAGLATAMAQTLAAGNWVSFAGIMTLVYYDAATDTVYNMNASYNTVVKPTPCPFPPWTRLIPCPPISSPQGGRRWYLGS